MSKFSYDFINFGRRTTSFHHYLPEEDGRTGKNIWIETSLDCLSSSVDKVNHLSDNYAHIWRTDQKTAQSIYRRPNVVEKQSLFNNSCRFQTLQKWRQRTKHMPTKNTKINPFVIEQALESKCQLFRITAKGNFKPKPEPGMNKTHPN